MRYEIFAYDENRIFGIDCIGYSGDTAVTRFGPGQRNLYIVHYVLSGRGVFNGREVKKGQGFLIVPGMPEHYRPDEAEPWSFLWVVFSDARAEKIFEKYHADPETHIFEYGDVRSVMSTADFLRGADRFCTSAELLEIFLHMFNRQRPERNNFERESDAYYNYAVNYINSNLFRAVTVEEITNIIGITQPYLYKIFIDKCGVSPKMYIINRKISEAKRLLLETELPVCEVAVSVGYSDALHFSKAFKRITGVSPTAFRSDAADVARGSDLNK